MPSQTDLCLHINEIEDYKNGDIICTDCGLILDKIFIQHSTDFEMERFSPDKEYIFEILHRLNIPNIHCSKMLERYKTSIEMENKQNCTNTKKSQLLTYAIYEVLNEYGIPISLKDISAVSGIATDKLFSEQSCATTFPLNATLEKYCSILGLSYKDFLKIQSTLPCVIQSGHNPTTILGSLLYKYSKDNSLDLSMKKIAHVLGISTVSIQRYLKKTK